MLLTYLLHNWVSSSCTDSGDWVPFGRSSNDLYLEELVGSHKETSVPTIANIRGFEALNWFTISSQQDNSVQLYFFEVPFELNKQCKHLPCRMVKPLIVKCNLSSLYKGTSNYHHWVLVNTNLPKNLATKLCMISNHKPCQSPNDHMTTMIV